MRLIEAMVCAAMLIAASGAFTGAFVNVRRNAAGAEIVLEGSSAALDRDAFFRKEIRGIEIPYWKNFSSEFSDIKDQIMLSSTKKGIEVLSVSSVYDKKHRAEGIRIEWELDGKTYATQEYIKQRIINDRQ